MTDAFVVDDYAELLALHKGLMEARFSDSPNDFYVSGSPILAGLHRRLVATMEARDAVVGEDPEKWQRWLAIDEKRREWALALNNVRNDSNWTRLNQAQRLAKARDYLAPFVASDEVLERFLFLANSMGLE